MPKASPAQVGDGDPNVVAHPGFRKLPACLFTLKTEKARDRYGELARLIWHAGRLSIGKHMALSRYAMLVDNIEQIEAEGRTPRASWFTQMARAEKELAIDDLDKPISAPKEAPVNRYARLEYPRPTKTPWSSTT